jgi:hypothetical protein
MWRCKQARATLLNYLTVKLLKTQLWKYEPAKLPQFALDLQAFSYNVVYEARLR